MTERTMTEADLIALKDDVRKILDDMPKADDYGKLQALMAVVMTVSGNGPASCAAFARAASTVLAHAGERVHVHVLSEGRRVVFEGDRGIVRSFEAGDDGDESEGGEPVTMH